MKIDALPVELLPVETLIPYEKNAKRHPDDQIEKLATAIKEFGWDQPIVVDTDMVIIKGHGRRLAALKLGLKKVPVVVRRDLSKAMADALRLSDNRVVSVDYDMAMIQEELARLAGEDIDLDIIGFDPRELEFSTDDLGAFDEDAFVENIGDAVEEQKEKNKAAAEEIDDVAAPVADAFGFKRVTIAQSRTIRELMGMMESRTGKAGAEALIDFISAAR